MIQAEKDRVVLTGLLHQAYTDLEIEKENSMHWYRECEKLRERIWKLEAKEKEDTTI